MKKSLLKYCSVLCLICFSANTSFAADTITQSTPENTSAYSAEQVQAQTNVAAAQVDLMNQASSAKAFPDKYYYNSAGVLTTVDTYYQDTGKLYKRVSYNANGTYAQVKWYDKTTQKVIRRDIYNSVGQRITKSDYDSNGKLTCTTDYNPATGYATKKQMVDQSSGEIKTYYYNDSGNLTKKTVGSKYTEAYTETGYDSNGRVLYETKYASPGKITENTLYTYGTDNPNNMYQGVVWIPGSIKTVNTYDLTTGQITETRYYSLATNICYAKSNTVTVNGVSCKQNTYYYDSGKTAVVDLANSSGTVTSTTIFYPGSLYDSVLGRYDKKVIEGGVHTYSYQGNVTVKEYFSAPYTDVTKREFYASNGILTKRLLLESGNAYDISEYNSSTGLISKHVQITQGKKTETTYDSAGKRISETVTTGSYVTCYTYSASTGSMLTSTHYTSGVKTHKINYDYDNRGGKEVTLYNSTGSVNRITYVNSSNYRVKEIIYVSNQAYAAPGNVAYDTVIVEYTSTSKPYGYVADTKWCESIYTSMYNRTMTFYKTGAIVAKRNTYRSGGYAYQYNYVMINGKLVWSNY